MRLLLAIALMTAAPAAAEPCHLATAAIACVDQMNAATAFHNFGRVPGVANARFLARYRCERMMSSRVSVIGQRSMPMPIGNIPVSTIIAGTGLWYVASAFLAGECKAHAAPVYHGTVQQDYAVPDYH